RTINGINFIRPLLETNRCAIEKFLKNKKIKFYTDVSNTDKTFLRNKIRLELLPMLQKTYNPNIKKTLVRFSQSMSLAYDYVKDSAAFFLNKCISKRKTGTPITIDLKKASCLHPAVLREMLRLAIEKLLGHTRGLTFTHVEAVEHLLGNQPNGSIVFLPYKLVAIKKDGFIIIQNTSKRLLIKQKKRL
ncbi:MAG: ATP-binding protein, partial [Candidatus Omnitrophota bacterium]